MLAYILLLQHLTLVSFRQSKFGESRNQTLFLVLSILTLFQKLTKSYEQQTNLAFDLHNKSILHSI